MARLPAAPAVSLREIHGAWWFVAPDGELFVSLGLNQVEAPLLLGSHNRRHTLRRYGDDFVGEDGAWNPAGEAVRRWIGGIRKVFRQLGFNTFGYHTTAPHSLLGDGLFYVRSVQVCPLGGPGLVPEYPDLFATEFAAEVDRRLKAVCAEVRADAACLGYAFADNPPWQEIPPTSGLHPWVRQLAEAPAEAAGKEAWLSTLRANHADAAAAASAYGLVATDWEDLAQARDWSGIIDPPALRTDNEAMLALLASRWYRLHTQVIRREDPGRLILGDKLRCGPAGLPEFLLPLVAEYTDLLCLECDTRFAEQAEQLRGLHLRTGLPVLLATSPFVVRSIAACGPGVAVGTHRELGQCYAEYLRGAMEAGFVVGWHYSGYLDAGGPGEGQHGLADPFGNLREDTAVWVRVVNQHANVWHARPCH